jgi:ATP-dependent HslUV protease ATP-binding subunit HslU
VSVVSEKIDLDKLTPKNIVAELDKYIVGQKKAKRAVAVALRNRTRRLKLDKEVQEDIAPKNILMIGPTGVGKTEIARRLARLTGSPFIKVEATKYTEVGYVGRDVESMIRDLMAAGVQMVKSEMMDGIKAEAEKRAEEKILDLLLPGKKKKKKSKKDTQETAVAMPMTPDGMPLGNFTFGPSPDGKGIMGMAISVRPANGAQGSAQQAQITADGEAADAETEDETEEEEEEIITEEKPIVSDATREKFRAMLRNGELEDREVEMVVNQQVQMPGFEVLGGDMEEVGNTLSGIAGFFGGNRRRKSVKVGRAREILIQEESDKLIDREKVSDEARSRVENMGIVFIDEIDKIAVRGERGGGGHDVSREGVQRDILPIVEGATVNTKWGQVSTDHILFIAAGAFNVSKPSDLIPELQGRFPLRVELESLGKDEFLRILTEPKNSLTKQYRDLLSTEEVEISFTADAIESLAAMAADVNSKLENIGARRLHTIMETLLEELSFDAPDIGPAKIEITPAYVNEKLNDIAKDQDLGRYIL